MKIFFFFLTIWIIFKITKFILSFQIVRKNIPNKKNDIRKSGMDIMDADYEEVE